MDEAEVLRLVLENKALVIRSLSGLSDGLESLMDRFPNGEEHDYWQIDNEKIKALILELEKE